MLLNRQLEETEGTMSFHRKVVLLLAAGVLAVGAAAPRPMVVDGELVAATVMTVTVSADHRVLDGAVAARWLAAFTTLMERPLRLLR